MSSPKQTQQWILENKPSGMPKLDGPDATFRHTTTDLPSSLPENSLLVKTLYISNDPAQRGWISDRIEPERLYVPPVPKGAPMRARSVAEVLESSDSEGKFKKGDKVLATTGWSQYAVLPAKECQPAPPLPGGLSSTHYLGALGLTGLTAYYGLVDVAKASPEDVVVVSGAAGATGCMVVQIAKKMVGCKKVIGIAGGKEKCDWVKNVMGADDCVDYKAGNIKEGIKKALNGDYANVFFDNVGGEVLDETLTVMAKHGRIAQCGTIANYNAEDKPYLMKNYFQVVTQRIKIEGFIIIDAIQQPGYIQNTTGKFLKAVEKGQLKVTPDMETVVDTKFEDIPKTWMHLFEGRNQGKLVTNLVD